MKYFRNPDVKAALALYALTGTVFIAVAFIKNFLFGVLTLSLCIIHVGIYLFFRIRNLKSVEKLSNEIDLILHGAEEINIDESREGELGILQSEIRKMTTCLRWQKQSLINDKMYLANSIADISHQIRTPLTSVNLLVSNLSKPDLTEKERREISHELYGMLSGIDRLITALLKISKLDSGTVTFACETVPLKALIKKALSPLLISAELKNQTISVEAEGNFFGDVDWTAEAVTNVVKNCMEHTPESGTIKVKATENALFSQIIISDNGAGISKEDLPHIFERFYKGKNSDSKGFGIGLALSRTIISSQNGTIKAENATPVGALFTIRFYKETV